MIYAVFKIIRPLNFVISFAAIFTGGIICGVPGSVEVLSFAGIAGALIGSGGNIINDFFDIEIDKVNRPERVLVSGKFLKSHAVILYSAVTFAGLMISISISKLLFIISFSAAAAIFLYSFKLKAVPLAGNLIVSLVTGFALIFGAAAVGKPAMGIIPAIFAFLVNFVREVLKDIEDLKGDKHAGVITFPARFGVRRSKYLITFLTGVLMFATVIPYWLELYKIEYFVIVMCVVNVLFVYFLREIWAPDFENRIRKLSSLLKLNMILGILAIVAGNL